MSQYYAPDFRVTIQGLELEPDIRRAVISLTYDNNMDQADMFRVTLDNSDLRFTDSSRFEVGQEVEVYMGYVGSELAPMMLGELVSIQPSFPEGGAPTISISGYDKSHRMRHNSKRRRFSQTNASNVASEIADKYQLSKKIQQTSTTLNSKTQSGSDMAILKDLARRSNFETYVKWSTLYFVRAGQTGTPVVLEWGRDLSSFSPRISTSRQVGMVSLKDYNKDLARKIEELVKEQDDDPDYGYIIQQIKKTPGFLDRLKRFGKKYISAESVGSHQDAESYARAILRETLEGLFEGSGSCMGVPTLLAGDMVDIRGVGKQFSGLYRLRSVSHTISSGGYRTNFEVSQRNSASMLSQVRKYVKEESSPHEQEKIYSEVVARVVDNVDPDGLGRVQVQYPWIDDDGKEIISDWATVMQNPSTHFLPEVKDDVVVTFEKGDIDRPIVMGISRNVRNKPPEAPERGNPRKIIRSRSGHRIVLDDSKGKEIILLESASGARIELDDQGGISLVSAGGAKIKLDGASNRIDLNPS